MLFLVGLGLSEKEIPIGAIDVCKKCDLFIDRYTSKISISTTNKIKELTNKEIQVLSRQEMEEGAKTIIKNASAKDVAILFGGDPLIATTHKIFYIEAKKQGVKIETIHANSIITAVIGESGLDFYRFGKTCTIPRWSEHYSPISFYEKIETNVRNKEHSILLLDYDQNSESTLSVKEALVSLGMAEEKYKKGIIANSTKIMIMHNISLEDQKIIFTTIEKASTTDFDDGVNVLILPAELTEIEKETVDSIAKVI
ncbi:MAG: diphthine synthase [Candidatus Micrarchaeaceae archaeon]|jgi:diphthine synthase